jgi:hypothetical protein
MFACMPAFLPSWLPALLPACSNKLLGGFKVAEGDASEAESEVRLPAFQHCMHACQFIVKKTAFCCGEVWIFPFSF